MKNDVPSLAEVMPSLLRSVLQVAYDLRWVADFLFTDLDISPFHKSLPLPPYTFETTFSIDVHQHMNIFPHPKARRSTGNSNDAVETGEEEVPLPVELVGEPDVNKTDDTLLHTIFVPVATHSFATVGYAFVSHPQTLPNCIPSNPLMPPLIARFVLDERDDTLIYINRGGTPPSLGIRAMRRAILPNVREHFSFVVPDAPYVWPRLPTSATWMLSHIETDTVSFVPPPPSRKSLCQIQLPNLDPTVQDASPWPISDEGTLSDGLTIALNYVLDTDIVPVPRDTTTAAAMFTPDVRHAALKALAAIHSGTFHSAGIRMDSLDGLTGTFRSCVTGAVVNAHAVTMPLVEDGLRLRFVQAYLSESCSVPQDVPLIRVPERCEAQPLVMGASETVNSTYPAIDFISELIENADYSSTEVAISGDVNGNTYNDTTEETLAALAARERAASLETSTVAVSVKRCRETVIAPRPKLREVSETRGADEESQTGQKTREWCGPIKTIAAPTKARRREDIIADRKQRNRLSAARSNERKRLWIAQLEEDVKLGREKVSQLSSRHDEAVLENKRLRDLLGQDSGNA